MKWLWRFLGFGDENNLVNTKLFNENIELRVKLDLAKTRLDTYATRIEMELEEYESLSYLQTQLKKVVRDMRQADELF